MADLTTKYMGIELRNPIVVSSSGLSATIQGVERCVRSGAGAVVLKSLFEEQIDAEIKGERGDDDLSIHPEAGDYLERMGKQLGPLDYLALIKEAKRRISEPIIASVNCVTTKWWIDWARQIEDAGADAIELNIAIMPRGDEATSEEIEARFLSIVARVKQAVGLPLAVKLGPYFTSLHRLASQLQRAGVRGLVLFNRFYQLDIDVDSFKLVAGNQFSTKGEIYQALRWTSMLSGQIGCDIAASTGVESGLDVVKLLLAGAQTVQVCSTLYRNGYEHIRTMISDVEKWMRQKHFDTVGQFRGKLVQIGSADPTAYERLQYIQALTGLS